MLAQVTAEFPWVQPIIQLTTAGGFGALVWFLVVKQIPQFLDRHRQERTEWYEGQRQRDAEFLAAQRERDAELVSALKEINGSLHDLRKEINDRRDKS